MLDVDALGGPGRVALVNCRWRCTTVELGVKKRDRGFGRPPAALEKADATRTLRHGLASAEGRTCKVAACARARVILDATMQRLTLLQLLVPLTSQLACSGEVGTPPAGPTSASAMTATATTGGNGPVTAASTSGTTGPGVGGAAAGTSGSTSAAGTLTTGSSNSSTDGGQVSTSTVGAGGASSTSTVSSANTSATTGAAGTSSTTGGMATVHDVFGSCRFHFGAIDQFARSIPGLAAELDFFTPGWMGVSDNFDQSYVCDDTEPGGPLEGLVPVVVSYVAAFYAKRHNNLNDCNVGSPDLCTHGALYIKQNLSSILSVYRSYAQGYANCFGTTKPIVFEMEPDYYQYTYDSQTDPMTPSEAGSIMSQLVGAIRESLPNAVFSMDISPWVAPNNGADGGAEWYSNFDMSLFTFVNTSGGSTDASNAKIRGSNNMTWAGVSAASGKSVLADTGYGVNGSSAGHDQNWDNPTYINQRIADGVVSISQYNPSSSWPNTIAQIRSQLDAPAGCQ